MREENNVEYLGVEPNCEEIDSDVLRLYQLGLNIVPVRYIEYQYLNISL